MDIFQVILSGWTGPSVGPEDGGPSQEVPIEGESGGGGTQGGCVVA